MLNTPVQVHNPEDDDAIWSPFTERGPGFSVDWIDLPGTWSPAKRRLYELVSAPSLADPVATTNMQNWTCIVSGDS